MSTRYDVNIGLITCNYLLIDIILILIYRRETICNIIKSKTLCINPISVWCIKIIEQIYSVNYIITIYDLLNILNINTKILISSSKK